MSHDRYATDSHEIRCQGHLRLCSELRCTFGIKCFALKLDVPKVGESLVPTSYAENDCLVSQRARTCEFNYPSNFPLLIAERICQKGKAGGTSENEIAAMKSIIIRRAIKAIGAEGETD